MVVELLSEEVDNTFSSALFLSFWEKKRQISGTLQCLCIRVCVRVCMYEQVDHVPMIHVFLLEISVVDMLEKLGT